MKNHFKLDDQSFEQKFSDCSFDPGLFSHEAHLRLAWIHINNYGLENAINNMNEQIKRYAHSLGFDSKFNRTVTEAAVKAVHHFMQRSISNNFRDFIQEFPGLKYKFKELLAAHYSIDIFTSEEAKLQFIEPDLSPF
ncbi:MAG: hypothetical protein ED557_02650 [Balneola sp.]|nr:MAG: hypothetical protein ED557_02650 [Balneola sp.]